MLKNRLIKVGETELITSAVLEHNAVLTFHFTNSDTVDRKINLYAKAQGVAMGQSALILKDFTIPAGDTFQWSSEGKFILGPEESITATCDATDKVNCVVNYMLMKKDKVSA